MRNSAGPAPVTDSTPANVPLAGTESCGHILLEEVPGNAVSLHAAPGPPLVWKKKEHIN